MSKKNYIKCICDNVDYLPSKDIKLATKFIDNRMFEELKDLTDSVIIKESKKDNSTINTDKLAELSADLAQYIGLINGEEPKITTFDLEMNLEELEEFENIEDFEDFYSEYNS